MTTVLIMAGGTGGHVFPALSVARVLRARACRVVWLGTLRGIEARLVPAEGITAEWLSVTGLRGKGPLPLALAPLTLSRALAQALKALDRHRPDVVLGLGGFAAGPGGVAAWMTRRPLVIHEQNAVAGLTNRFLAQLATRVAAAFPGSFSAALAPIVIGNPVRPEIEALPEPAARAADGRGRLRLLVFGGSQGAAALNRLLPAALATLAAEERPELRHQAGRGQAAAVGEAYAAAGITATVEEFIEDMAGAYGWADLVVCRAGALTISELAAAGLPSILIPFPAAVDDHQTANARYLAERGAAVLLPEETLDPKLLAREIRRLCQMEPDARLAMAEAARRAATPGAAERLANLCLHLVATRSRA
jgi:UDP-N-acetylglucosamine--N-acetylmuramyl-(pentapeptide) pyrophosphoryl-undecaprenol N-acetylglucosamine transferase